MATEDVEDEDLDFEDAPGLDDYEDDLDFFHEILPELSDEELDGILEAAGSLAATVASVALLDLFSDAFESVDAAEDADTPELEFNSELDEKLDDMWGEEGSMLDTIFDTNAQQGFNDAKSDGDADQGWEYAQYLAEPDACPICFPLHGTILPADDPWWDEYDPPNHCNCACAKVPLSAEEAGERGGETRTPVDDVDVQPGFGSDRGDVWVPDLTTRPPELVHEFHRSSP